MKILIIGELNENSLSSNTMEMIGKANELSTDVFVTTIGSVDSQNANVENTTSNYIKVNDNDVGINQIERVISLEDDNYKEADKKPSKTLKKEIN